ncbi:hypothetical protein DRJ17_03725 [Candidatus Woesearchaeota archaeon]|nr:MAG: hypothetical protein DRJ17_03725 [Candidatus Woesearchaeota archaeon]
MKLKNLLAVLLLIITFIATAIATVYADSNFAIQKSIIKDSIIEGESANFIITIANYANEPQEFELSSPDEINLWSFFTQPLTDKAGVIVPAGSVKNVSVFFQPFSYDIADTEVRVKVKNKDTGISQTVSMIVKFPSAAKTQPGEYVPNYVASATMTDRDIDPSAELLNVVVTFKNKNQRNIPEIIVHLYGNTFDTTFNTSLGPFESKTETYAIELDPNTPPQLDSVSFDIYIPKPENYTLSETFLRPTKPVQALTFTILGYSSILKEESIRESFLKTERIITYKNAGTNTEQLTEEIPVSIFKKIKYDLIPSKEGDKYTWTLTPGQTLKLVITASYQGLFIALMVIVAIVIVSIAIYFIKRSPIVLNKSVGQLKTKEGGISTVKIRVDVKNRSKQNIKYVKIIDKIPRIASLISEIEPGTLTPSKTLKHDTKGTLLEYEIDQLDSGEERIITYSIKCKLSVLGDFKLPRVIAKYNYKGAAKISRSNSLVLKNE